MNIKMNSTETARRWSTFSHLCPTGPPQRGEAKIASPIGGAALPHSTARRRRRGACPRRRPCPPGVPAVARAAAPDPPTSWSTLALQPTPALRTAATARVAAASSSARPPLEQAEDAGCFCVWRAKRHRAADRVGQPTVDETRCPISAGDGFCSTTDLQPSPPDSDAVDADGPPFMVGS